MLYEKKNFRMLFTSQLCRLVVSNATVFQRLVSFFFNERDGEGVGEGVGGGKRGGMV